MIKFTPEVYTQYQTKQLRLIWFIWGAIFAIILADIALIVSGSWKIHYPWLRSFLPDLVALGLCAIVFHIIRFRADVIILVHSIAQLIVLPIAGVVLSYLLAGYIFPLQDEKLIYFDSLFVFDWLGFIAFLNQYPIFAKILSFSYDSMMMQVTVIIPLLCFIPRMDYVQRFIAALLVTSLITVFLATIFPAVGGYTHYNINLADYSNLNPSAAFLHRETFFGLREGSIDIIGHDMQGIVTFPSFHTVIAILLVYASYPLVYIRWGFLFLNILMIISTVSDGGHYLSDVIGGAVIALFSLLIVSRLLPEPPPEELKKTTFKKITI